MKFLLCIRGEAGRGVLIFCSHVKVGVVNLFQSLTKFSPSRPVLNCHFFIFHLKRACGVEIVEDRDNELCNDEVRYDTTEDDEPPLYTIQEHFCSVSQHHNGRYKRHEN